MPAASHDRYGHIDALRAIAALLVLWLHSVTVLEPYLPVQTARSSVSGAVFNLLDIGRAGVVLFFAISGFVIPASLVGPRGEGARRFLIRRFFRLYPLFWVSVFATALSLWVLHEPAPLRATLANLSMMPRTFGEPFINGVYWTLETELVFYAICLGFFLLRIVDRPAAFAGLIVGCLVAHLAWRNALSLADFAARQPSDLLSLPHRLAQAWIGDPEMIRRSPNHYFFLHLSVMGLGALCRFQFEGQLGRRWLKIFLALVIGYWTLWIWPKPVWKWTLGQWDWGGAREAFTYAAPIAFFAIMVRYRSFGWQPLVYLGTISYSIYLMHLPIIYVTAAVIQNGLLSGISLLPASLLAAAIAMMTIAVSALTFKAIEQPAISLGRRLSSGTSKSRIETVVPPIG